MALTHYQVGAIVSGCSGTVLIVIGLILVFVHPVRRFTFPYRKCPSPIPISTIRDEENQRPSTSSNHLSNVSPFETIGNITIPPGRRPLPSALDVINRVAMAVCLPADAKLARLKSVPIVSLHLPPLTPMTLTTNINIAMAEAGTKVESLHAERDAMHMRALSSQAPLARREAVVQERKMKHEAYIASRRAEPNVVMEKCDFDLVLAICSTEQLEKTQDVFVVDYDDDGGLENAPSANHQTTHGFGSGKAMAALYHAV